MTTTDRPDRWTPQARGLVFCSPACGANCTAEEHNRAQDGARALAERLGPAWRPVVWENLGWHYKAQRGGAKVHPSAEGFMCLLSPDDSPGGTWVGGGMTPQQALADAMRQAVAQRDEITTMLEALRDD